MSRRARRIRRRAPRGAGRVIFLVAGALFAVVALVAVCVGLVKVGQWKRYTSILRDTNESRVVSTDELQKEVDAIVAEAKTLQTDAAALEATTESQRAENARSAEEQKSAPKPRYSPSDAAARRTRATQAFGNVLSAVAGVGKPSTPDVGKLIEAISAESDRLATSDPRCVDGVDDLIADAAKRNGRADLEQHHLSRVAAAPKAPDAPAPKDADAAAPPKTDVAGAKKQIDRLQQLAQSLVREGKVDEGAAKGREAIEIARALPEDQRKNQLISVLEGHGARLLKADRAAEAEPVLREAYEIHRSSAKKESSAGVAGTRLALAMLRIGRADEAERVIDQVLAAYDEANSDFGSHDMLSARAVKLLVLHALGRTRDEERLQLEVNEAITFQFEVFGGTSNAEWVEYLTTISSIESAEHCLWSATMAALGTKTKGRVEETVRDIVAMLEKNGKPERAAMYKRWVERRGRVASDPKASE